MYCLCFCVQPLTVLGHLIQNFDKLSLKNCPLTKSITFFWSKIFSYIIKSVRKIFRRNLQKATEDISAEVFPPKCLGFNVFQWFSKSKFLSFLTKVNPNNGNETKSNIFSWNLFKSDFLFFKSENIKSIQSLWPLKFLSFMTRKNLNNEIKIKPDIFPWDLFKSDVIFFIKK